MDTNTITLYIQARRELRRHEKLTRLLYIASMASVVVLAVGIASNMAITLAGFAACLVFGITYANIALELNGGSRRNTLQATYNSAELTYKAMMHDEYDIYRDMIIAEYDRIAEDDSKKNS